MSDITTTDDIERLRSDALEPEKDPPLVRASERVTPPGVILGQVDEDTTKPTTLNKFYRIRICFALGLEVENTAAIFHPQDHYIYAIALGPTVPTLGQEVICFFVPHRYVFHS